MTATRLLTQFIGKGMGTSLDETVGRAELHNGTKVPIEESVDRTGREYLSGHDG